ncbi:MAG: hypothetical protein RIC55_07005 [Pirellulaceae bacterium]
MRYLIVCGVVFTLVISVAAAAEVDSVAAWEKGVRTRAVLGDAECHSIHTYFNTCPESPDGRWVLLYRSTAPQGHGGQVCIVERETGKVRVLADGVVTEDAHRAACQQWVQDGRTVVFHDLRDGRWVVAAVDVATGDERVIARDRQLSWGQPHSDVVPVYGPHWDPKASRDLELVNVATGEARTVLTAAEVRDEYADWMQRTFGDRPVSIFFPILSPDQKRVLLKLAAPAGGDFRSKQASDRYGLVAYDLAEKRFLYMSPRWGHPAWHPSSRQIVNTANRGVSLVDLATGRAKRNLDLPPYPGSHPSSSPSGTLFVTDIRFPGDVSQQARELWGVAVGNHATGEHTFVDRFENGEGATSWRRSHPHPVFSHDGRRIYYNVSAGPWTRLYVAECGVHQ